MRVLLDTCVISELVSAKPCQTVLDWLNELDEAKVFLSVITLGELKAGIERLPSGRRKHTLREWFEDDLLIRFRGRIVEIDQDVIIVWGELVASMEELGRPLPVVDSLIAASAIRHNLTLATRNVKDFERTGVRLVNPWNR